ncbi:MAG: hypothetical protein V4515_12580 [Chloroflexota bacterium]
MSDSILDLIDNAIDAYESSPDAMRWRPDGPSGDQAIEWFDEVHTLTLTEWQQRLVRTWFDAATVRTWSTADRIQFVDMEAE